MNCAECKEMLVSYTERLLIEEQRQPLEEHLSRCADCQKELEEITQLQQRLRANGDSWRELALEDEVLNRVMREQKQRSQAAEQLNRRLWIRRIIMQSKIARFAAAAVVIIAVGLAITFLNQTVPTAYALEQTIQASHSVRSLHIKDYAVGHEEPKQFWVECDQSGRIRSARSQFPDWASGGDGAKNVVWNNGRVEVHFLRKNVWFIANDQATAQHMLKLVQELDPRLVVERLHQLQDQGKVDVKIDTPADKAQPIVVTVTYPPDSPKAGCRQIFFVDQATKLLTSLEHYKLKDGEYELVSSQEFFDYNQQITPEMFTLDDEVPADVMKVDQTIKEVGLVQGNMSDKEVAVEVARQFFEALIAEDYNKAGQLFEGVPAEALKEGFAGWRFLKIISIGPAKPHPTPATGGLVVPCTVEIETEGKVTQHTFDRLGVRQVFNQPGRWTIFGGI